MKKTCKPGDLAVVISSANEANRGLIVEVLRPHGGGGTIHMKRDEPVWDVRCAVKMVWTFPGSDRPPYRAKEGPVPDSCLWPIRPGPVTRGKSARRKITSIRSRTDEEYARLNFYSVGVLHRVSK